MAPLRSNECMALMAHRAQSEGVAPGYNEQGMAERLGGGHPFLLQQILNMVLDDLRGGRSMTEAALTRRLHANDLVGRTFALWWNAGGKTDGFRPDERRIYRALAREGEASVDALATLTGLTWSATASGLEVLAGTGVARSAGELRYALGSHLFEVWAASQPE